MKKGISLIVLVITIIIMVILAASVVLTLSNTGIINKANQAVNLMNEKEVQDMASILWADAYANKLRDEALSNEVINNLNQEGITTTDWNINVTNTGVTVSKKDATKFATTLGELVTSALDYGKTVNYVSDNGVTEWKVFYHTDDYVYLIASEKLAYDKTPTNIPRAIIEANTVLLADGIERKFGQIYWEQNNYPNVPGVIQNPDMWMAEWDDYSTNINARCMSYFIDETYWTNFKNSTASYKNYVVSAIGTPTINMFAASWNAKKTAVNDSAKYNVQLNITKSNTSGYSINGSITANISTLDDLYVWSTLENTSYWLASPSSTGTSSLIVVSYTGVVGQNYYYKHDNKLRGFRPVVCLSADIPAGIGTTTDFEI